MGIDSLESNSAIEQYKSYFKKLNIKQYGVNVLLDELNKSNKGSNLFNAVSTPETSGIDNSPSDSINIDKDSVINKVLSDLENKILGYVKKNPEYKGEFIIGVNYSDNSSIPNIKILSKEDVFDKIPEDQREFSEKTIQKYPLQIFDKENIDIDTLSSDEYGELQDIVDTFLQKNSSVFEYLSK